SRPGAEELLEDPALTLGDLEQRRRALQPLAAVDLREEPSLTGPGGPLELKRVAPELRGVAVPLHSPHVHALAARLPEGAEFVFLTTGARVEARLLREFAPRAGELILTGVHEALRHRPGALVLARPERSARVHEEHLQDLALPAIEQQSGAGHASKCLNP